MEGRGQLKEAGKRHLGKAECAFRTAYHRALEAFSSLIKNRSYGGKRLSMQLIKYTRISKQGEKIPSLY